VKTSKRELSCFGTCQHLAEDQFLTITYTYAIERKEQKYKPKEI